MSVLFRRAGLISFLLFWAAGTILSAAEKIPGTLTVHDSLTSPNQPAVIEATLKEKSLLTETGLGGEPIELLVAGNVVATAMTGGAEGGVAAPEARQAALMHWLRSIFVLALLVVMIYKPGA